MPQKSRSALTIICVIALFLLIALGSLWRHCLGPRYPKLATAYTVSEFGEADADSHIECLFRIRNVGRSSLTVGRVGTDCSCSNVRIDKKEIQPGESAEIRVDYQTPDRGGAVSSNIVVETNDPGARLLHLKIIGIVRPKLQIVPKVLYFGSVGADAIEKIPVRAATVYTWSSEAASFEGIRSSEEWISALFVPAKEGEQELGRISVSLAGIPPKSRNEARIEVHARSGGKTLKKELVVLVDLVKGNVSIVPHGAREASTSDRVAP